MINLLPPQEKEQLLILQRRNLAVIICVVLLAYLLSLALILLIINFSLLLNIQQQQSILANSETIYQDSDFVFYKDLVEKNNQNLIILHSFYKNNAYVSDILKDISAVERPAGIKLTNISIGQAKSGDLKISEDADNHITIVALSGISDNRDSLSAFKDALTKDQKISNMDFPADNWLQSKDINFQLTFQYQQ